MTIDTCKGCPFYMVHFKDEVLCNFLYEVRERRIDKDACVRSCPKK